VRAVSRYLERSPAGGRALFAPSSAGVLCVVVIPVLAEMAVLPQTLESLAANPWEEAASALVVAVVNHAPETPPEERGENVRTLRWLGDKIRRSDGEGGVSLGGGRLRLALVDAASPGLELAAGEGVGTARRIGLDLGLRVLHDNGCVEGPLISLDADTLVEPGYLRAIRGHFEDPAAWGAVAAYRHPVEGTPEARAAILAYETYLRCHVLGLRFAGSPYAFPTIGSTIACRGTAYAAVSGMPARRAGEDFYFLQKLAKTGGVDCLFTTAVHPSPRVSRRTPFGTGRAVAGFLSGEPGARPYPAECYRVLRSWLSAVRAEPGLPGRDLLRAARGVDLALGDYLEGARFEAAWDSLRRQAPSREALLAQFHRWFDAFRTLRLIRVLRDRAGPPECAFTAARRLLETAGMACASLEWDRMESDLDARAQLLERLRSLEAWLPSDP